MPNDLSTIRHLRLPLHFDPLRLQADLEAAQHDSWTPHFNQSYYDGDWSGLALRALRNTTNPLHSNRQDAPGAFTNTPALDRCPYFQDVLSAFQCPLKAVRLLRLKAGSVIKEHSDGDLGYDLGEIRFHIPVITNPQVEFYLEGERVVMSEGECWYLDLSRLHRVQNLGCADRVHLVIDAVLNDWARSILSVSAKSQPPVESLQSSARRLEEFKEIVLGDPDLQRRLRGISHVDDFLRQTVRLGEESGYRFTVEDVQSALQAASRAWIERWV